MEKYTESKKIYNSNKTFVQISKTTHNEMKKFCKEKNIKVKDFIEGVIIEAIKK